MPAVYNLYTSKERVILSLEKKQLDALTKSAKKATLTRTTWIQQAIAEKLDQEKKEQK
jgi:metal-responsive CopG/Arc/MetJ family transcriptional regulator